MKAIAKKLSSMFLALVMVVSITPATGALLADETDAETPAVTESKETEKPASETKESKKPVAETPKETEAPEETEAPKETVKETEAPAETTKETEAPATEAPKETVAPAAEAPKETEAPKEEAPVTKAPKTPSGSDKQDKKNGPSQVPSIANVTFDEETGVLKWKNSKYKNPEYDPDDEYSEEYIYPDYEIRVSGACAYLSWIDGNYDEDDPYVSVNLYELIDKLITDGEIKKSENDYYVYWLLVYTDTETLVAAKSDDITYKSSAKCGKKMGSIKASLNQDTGILKWSTYKGVSTYSIYINEYFDVIWTKRRSIPLKEEIDFLIRAGYIQRTSTYDIRIVGSNNKGKKLAKWSGRLKYISEAEPVKTPAKITGVKFEDGYMKWDAVEHADGYWVRVFNNGTELDLFYVSENQADINNHYDFIVNEWFDDEEIDINNLHLSYKVEAYEYSASDSYYEYGSEEFVILAESDRTDHTIVVAPNPLSVSGKKATVKYKKLKKKKQSISVFKVISGLSTGRGPKSYTKLSGDKRISINKSTGRVTLKKGMKKKTYTIKVKVNALGNAGYEPSDEQIVTIRIRVK